jgi:hypothetical protein
VVPTVTIASSFKGLDTVDAGSIVEPPDTIAAASPTHVVEVVNSNIAYYDKSTGSRVFATDLGTFFAPVDSVASLFSDVYVGYDESVGRFWVSTMDIDFFNLVSYFDFAISNDSNPTHGFTEMHQIDDTEISPRTGETLFTDFPRVGWNADVYVISFNMTGFMTEVPYNTQILTISKASVLDQNNATLTMFQTDRPLPNSTMVPATMHGSVTGDPMWFVQEKGLEQDGQYLFLRIVKETNVLSSNPTFTDYYVQVDPYTITPFPNDPLGQVTSTLDTRILSVDWRGGTMVATQDVGIPSDMLVHARWYVLSTSGSAPSLIQQGTLNPGPTSHTYMPCAAITASGAIGMTYIQSGDTENMSMYITGRTATDFPGTMQPGVLVEAGAMNYQGTRAGDFAGLTVDPTDGTSFWAANEYAETTSDITVPNWGTWIAHFNVSPTAHMAISAPTSATSGSPFSITVTARNANGTTNTGYRGTVHFTSTDGMPTLPPDYTFTAADNGVHTFTNAVTLRTVGTQTVTATDSVNHVAGSANVTVNPTAAASMFAVAGFVSPTTAGTAHSFTVTAENANGNRDTSYTGTVHFTSTDSQAVLPANYTFTAADMGMHTFSATLKTAGTRSITATDTVTSSITGTQSGIVVNPAAATRMTVSGFPSTITAGVAGNVTVTLKDSFGNVATGYRGTVHFTSTDSQAVLPPNYTFMASDAGVHTFSVTLKTAGVRSMTATDTVTSSLTGTESKIQVNAAAASALVVAGYPSPVVAGTSNNFTVTARDLFGNTATSYRGTVHFTSSDSQATLPANFTFVAGDNGVHTFSAAFHTTGTRSITATDTVTSSITGTQSGIVVNPAGGIKLRISIPGRIMAGVPIEIVVTALDAFGNLAKNFMGTVHFSSSDSQALLPADYTFTSGPGLDNGTHRFTVTFANPGSQSLIVASARESDRMRVQRDILVMDPPVKPASHSFAVSTRDANQLEWIAGVSDDLLKALLG